MYFVDIDDVIHSESLVFPFVAFSIQYEIVLYILYRQTDILCVIPLGWLWMIPWYSLPYFIYVMADDY